MNTNVRKTIQLACLSTSMGLLEATDTIHGWISNRDEYSFHPWDPIGELIQGSVRELLDCEDSHFSKIKPLQHQLKIVIDEKEKSILIVDYGRGFTDINWLALHRSGHPKAKKIQSGFGLGLSSVLSQSDKFSILTRTEAKKKMKFVEYIDVATQLDKEFQVVENGGKVSQNFLQEKFSNFSGDCTDYGIDSSYDGTFTSILVQGNTFLNHMWDYLDEHGSKNFFESVLYHSALGLTNKVHGKKLPREIKYQFKMVESAGKTITENRTVGGHALIPKQPIVKISSTTTAGNKHFLSYTHKGKAVAKNPDHIKIDIQAYCAFGDFGGKNGKTRITEAYGDFLQISKDKAGSSNIFLSVEGFPQPIRFDFPDSKMGNKSTVPWTVIWVDVDKQVMSSGRNAIDKSAAEKINPKIIEAINAIELRYHKNKGVSNAGPGIAKGIGGKGAKKGKSGGSSGTNSGGKNAGSNAKGQSGNQAKKNIVKNSSLTTKLPNPITNLPTETVLLENPVSEDEVELLFICLAQSGYLPGIKIFQKGHNQTTYDWTIRPNWPVQKCGAQYQIDLSKEAAKKGITITNQTLVAEVIDIDFIAETKTSLDKLIKDIYGKASKKSISDIHIGIVWENKLTKAQKNDWNVLSAIPDEKFHPSVNYVLESKSDPSDNIQLIVMNELFA
jgi:hypothetical protein